MLRRRLIWQFYPFFLLVTLAALIAVAWYCTYSFRGFYYKQTRTELKTAAQIIAAQLSPRLDTAEPNELDQLCRELGRFAGGQMRITLILASGKVVGDSDEDPAVMEDHSDRSEVFDALRDGFGSSVRFSHTVGKNMMYVAIPLRQRGEVAAALRTAVPVTAIDQAFADIYVRIFWGGVITAAGAAGLSLLVSRRISQPIVRMKQVAERFAGGELNLRVPVPRSAELGGLAEALNEMARQLHERILTITDQRNELEAILSSMVEGVVAVDGDGRIVSINNAASRLLTVEPDQVQDRHVEEVTRNPDFHKFMRETLEKDEPCETEIFLPMEGGRSFQLHGTSLSDSRGRTSGAVIVLNDVTRMRRLETIRRDFVANVSHELRTPVTSIQGYVEALLEGVIDNREQSRRFLAIIAKHSDRLNAIIEDLLSLSRLEEEEEQRNISFETTELKGLVESAAELAREKATEKHVRLELICEYPIAARVNAALLEQAVLNLIDNAIKYSEPNGTVKVSVQQQGPEVAIAVQDNGCGIEKKHLSRIFERFYVADKGRSRKLGGTGLGLAIVKHIAQVHGGSVRVESSPRKGSTFTIRLPAG